MRTRFNVLFVCMGNICRSPTADGVLRHMAAHHGLQDYLTVDSAGTHNYHPGSPPDERSQHHAALRGYDLSSLRARQVVDRDFEAFEHVLDLVEDACEGLLAHIRQGR